MTEGKILGFHLTIAPKTVPSGSVSDPTEVERQLKKHLYHTFPSLLSFASFILVLLVFLAPTAIFDESLAFLKISHSNSIATTKASSNIVGSSLNVELEERPIPGRLMSMALRRRQTESSTKEDDSDQLLLGTLGSCVRIQSTTNCSSSSLVPYFLNSYLDFGLEFPAVRETLGLPISFPLIPLLLLFCIILLFSSFVLFLLAALPIHTAKMSALEAKHRLFAKTAVLTSASALLVGIITTVIFRLQLGDAEQSFNAHIDKKGVLNLAEVGNAFSLIWAAWGLTSGAVVIGIIVLGLERD
ncbi:hypothetical protein BT69DRAFT_1352639 [Atractiella rhizophila]|nr:hypothetical protein BT69DRAFT_1352809 [Atractiella rhizophila]KAH8920144.1 hypothetical protein BT69DRAFT_1352639 [Atractiella rhizophila]